MKIILSFCFSLLFLFLFVETHSQDHAKKDSLLRLISYEKQDTTSILIYEQLAELYLKSDIDSVLLYTSKGLNLAEKLEYNNGIGKMYHLLGHVMVVKDSLLKAKTYYFMAIDYYKKAGNIAAQATSLMIIGNINLVQENLPEALNYYIIGLKIADSLNLIDLLPHFYNNLGAVYYSLEEYELALENFESGLMLCEKNEDAETSISILVNMSEIYMKLNLIDQAKQFKDKAEKLVKESNIQNNYKIELLRTNGSIEIALGNYESALEYYKKALETIDNMEPGYLGPISVEIANCRTRLGICYFNLGKFNAALKDLFLGFDVAKEIGLLGTQKDAAQYISEVYDKIGNTRAAFDYYKIYKTLSDSISNEHTSKKITQLKMQFEFDKKMKEQEINRIKTEANQKRKEIILFVIIGGILVVLIIFILLYLLQKNKSKRIFLERKNLQLDLESKNKELTTNVMYLLKKNEFIESISDKLKKAKLYFKPENRAFIDNIVKELESSSTKDTWQEFEVRFQQVHSDFYKKLTDKYPDLSPNDLKLCAFLRLNMSTKEISAITYQSYNTLSTARYRLRKKLDLDDHANLISFLSQF